MVTILQRYIAKTVILTTLLVVLVMLGLAYFISFLGELHYIGVGNYGVAQAALHALLELPFNLYQFFPMLVLIGGLMGLGTLASHQELLVMRTSGVSYKGIVGAVLAAAIVLIIFSLLIGELLAPRAHYLADQHKSIAESKGQAVVTASGVWLHEKNNFFHIDRVVKLHHLEGVTRYEFAGHQLLATYYAKAMDYTNKEWKLHDVVKTIFVQGGTRSQRVAETKWDLGLNPNLLNIGLIEPDEMPLTVLISYTRHLVKNGLQSAEFQFNLWKRIFRPLTILVMLLLAIPFVFAAPRSVTMGLRIVLGIVVGFVFYIFNALLGQICVVFQLSPLIAALIPTLVFALGGYVWMVRAGG